MDKKMNFKYFYGTEADQFSFYRIPKALFTNECFKDLSSDAKILYMIVGTERRHGFSQNDVDRQWHQIVDKIRKKQVDGVIVANMSAITDNLIDAFIKIAQVQDAGGIIVTVDDGRLAMQLRGF